MKSVNVLFIHRSVGNNLLKDGELKNEAEKSFNDKGLDVRFKDINNNVTKGVPGDDTRPKEYASYFKNHIRKEDIVIIKSCYPNNAIPTDAALDELKQIYKEIAKGFTANSLGKLLIMTTPPLRPFRTNVAQAHRAQELARWLTEQQFGKRVAVFDFYDLLADRTGMLKAEYRRLTPWDNHPSKKASRSIAPILADAIAELIN